jgi:hypothetical protein
MCQTDGYWYLIARNWDERDPLKIHSNLVVAGLVALLLAFPFGLSAQENDCPDGPPLLSPSQPIYSDAMELKQTLESHGFVVRCVFPTKLGSIFEVWEGGVMHSTIAGEANFRTNYGEVDAVFMPHPQTFADFKITEHRKDSGFLYTFAGTPRVWDTNRFGSARRLYFLDHGSQLFFINDVALLHRLERALQVQHRSF